MFLQRLLDSGGFIYIAIDEGWLYLAVVLDLFSRQVVSMEHAAAHAEFTGEGCVAHGMVQRAPDESVVFHSGRGT